MVKGKRNYSNLLGFIYFSGGVKCQAHALCERTVSMKQLGEF